jgi:ketosteroid isomerase-like protein
MAPDTHDATAADRLQAALQQADPNLLAPLLAEDVTWGEVGTPQACSNRAEVLANLRRLQAAGIGVDVLEVAQGRHGVLCGLDVHWPAPLGVQRRYQVYRLRDGQVFVIEGYEDRPSAAEAAGLT